MKIYFLLNKICLEPCMDRDILFQCPNDYPHSCIDRTFKCNGRSECPSGDDERGCNFETYSDTIPLRVIILVVLGTIFSICIISTGNLNDENAGFNFIELNSFNLLLLSCCI
jgi:hypothetical protein